MTAQEAFELLYNGTGVVYVTDDTGLLSPYANISGLKTWTEGNANLPSIEGSLLDIFATNSGYSVNGYASSVCTMTLAGANNCTAVNVGGVNQLSAPVAMIAADIPGSVAAIVAAINAYNVTPASDNCRAVQSGNSFYVVETVAGDSHNGETVTISFSTVASAATGTNMAGGRAAGGRPYRIFLDPSPTASLTVLNPASAVEITSAASFKGMESPAVAENVVVATNSVVFNRTSSFMQVYIDGVTTVGAANRVDSILGLGAIEGDVVILSGIDGSTPPIINTGALTYLEYVRTLTGYASTLTMRMAEDGQWYQMTPNPASAAAMRAAGITVPLQPGTYKLVPVGGTQTIYPGSTGVSGAGTVYEHDISLEGTPVILGSSLEFTIDLTDALDGDSGTIDGNRVSIDLNGNAINFNDTLGTVTSMTAAVADQGAWTAQWKVCDISATPPVISWVITPSIDTTNAGIIDTLSIADQSVTNAKIANDTIDGSTKLVDYSVTEIKLSPSVAAKLNAQGRTVVTIPIATAEVLTLNSVPVLAIPALGAGNTAWVSRILAKVNFASTIYATNVNLQLKFSGAGEAIAESNTFLIRTANGIVEIPMLTTVAAGSTQYLANTDLYISVETGDPTAGDSDIVLYIEYTSQLVE